MYGFLFHSSVHCIWEEVYIQEETGESEQENSIYDALRERIQDSWESGMVKFGGS